jgi:hypothetical protein
MIKGLPMWQPFAFLDQLVVVNYSVIFFSTTICYNYSAAIYYLPAF